MGDIELRGVTSEDLLWPFWNFIGIVMPKDPIHSADEFESIVQTERVPLQCSHDPQVGEMNWVPPCIAVPNSQSAILPASIRSFFLLAAAIARSISGCATFTFSACGSS